MKKWMMLLGIMLCFLLADLSVYATTTSDDQQNKKDEILYKLQEVVIASEDSTNIFLDDTLYHDLRIFLSSVKSDLDTIEVTNDIHDVWLLGDETDNYLLCLNSDRTISLYQGFFQKLILHCLDNMDYRGARPTFHTWDKGTYVCYPNRIDFWVLGNNLRFPLEIGGTPSFLGCNVSYIFLCYKTSFGYLDPIGKTFTLLCDDYLLDFTIYNGKLYYVNSNHNLISIDLNTKKHEIIAPKVSHIIDDSIYDEDFGSILSSLYYITLEGKKIPILN